MKKMIDVLARNNNRETVAIVVEAVAYLVALAAGINLAYQLVGEPFMLAGVGAVVFFTLKAIAEGLRGDAFNGA